MAARFANLDRQTPMFLSCDLREWVPDGPIVHFVMDAVDQIPTTRPREMMWSIYALASSKLRLPGFMAGRLPTC